MEMTAIPSFELIFEKVDEARVSLGADHEAALIALQQQSEGISELMTVARHLSEPPPSYFTRG